MAHGSLPIGTFRLPNTHHIFSTPSGGLSQAALNSVSCNSFFEKCSFPPNSHLILTYSFAAPFLFQFYKQMDQSSNDNALKKAYVCKFRGGTLFLLMSYFYDQQAQVVHR